MPYLFIMSGSSIRRSGMARVNEVSRSLPATHTFIHTYGMSHTCLYSQPKKNKNERNDKNHRGAQFAICIRMKTVH